MKPCYAVIASLFLANCAFAQSSAPPTFKVVVSTDNMRGQLIYSDTVQRYVFVQKQIFEIVNGQQVAKFITEQVPVSETRHISLALADCRVITPNGKQLALDEVMKRLKAKDVFTIAGNSNTPVDVFLRALHPDTLVVIPAPPKAVPVPMPKQ